MNRERAAKIAAIYTLLAEGKTLQYKNGLDGEWVDTDGNSSGTIASTPQNYRAKPQVFKSYVIIYSDGSCHGGSQLSDAELRWNNVLKVTDYAGVALLEVNSDGTS